MAGDDTIFVGDLLFARAKSTSSTTPSIPAESFALSRAGSLSR
jgi:hypothetical protein